MRIPIIAGNWKMHTTRASAAQLAAALAPLGQSSTVEIVLFPPFPYLFTVQEQLAGSRLQLGAQNMSTQAAGAYTGEVSGEMLLDLGCRYVLVGHSERRALYQETDRVVAEKFARALSAGLTPILCVGETLQERESDTTFEVLGRQLTSVWDRCGINALAASVIAYEPVWAIGTGKTASPAQAQEVHAWIRSQILNVDAKIGGSVRLIYGGSVKANNATELLSQVDIDGALVGGASLDANEFARIVRSLDG